MVFLWNFGNSVRDNIVIWWPASQRRGRYSLSLISACTELISSLSIGIKTQTKQKQTPTGELRKDLRQGGDGQAGCKCGGQQHGGHTGTDAGTGGRAAHEEHIQE